MAAVADSKILEPVARVQAAFDRYTIKNAEYFFSADQSGLSFSKVMDQSKPKSVGRKNMQLMRFDARPKGNMEHVIFMPTVSADGASYKPVLVSQKTFVISGN